MENIPEYSVLVVDDAAVNVDILVETLGDYYDVRVAMDGRSALSQVAEDPPDLILLDIMMPGMDGYEVCQRLKANTETRDAPVIFISALHDTNEKVRGLALGAVDYITKPFDVREVLARVKRQLEINHERRLLIRENQKLMDQTAHAVRSPEDRAEFVSNLIRNGENETVEFKSTLRWNLNKQQNDLGVELAWVKTVVAFLNSNGGTLIVGVDDNGHVIGHTQDGFDNEDKYLLHVNNRIQQNIGLEHAPCIRFALEPVEGEKILIIECSPTSEPVFMRHGNDESFFIRIGPGTRKLSTSQVLAYMSERQKNFGGS